MANHGGGYVALGLSETGSGVVEAEGRPATLDSYNQDLINGIVQNYCDPPFHCAVCLVPNPDELLYPVVVVPGRHRVPVRARRAGPHGNIVQNNAIYIRKPGPRSETPQSAQDWDDLLAKCLRNRRDEMFDQIRDLITGAVPQIEQPREPARLDDWIRAGFERWHTLTKDLPEHFGPRFTHGYYNFAYEIIGEPRQISPTQLRDVVRASEVRYSGWSPFWCPTREEIAPYLFNGAVECWLGGDTQTPAEKRTAARSNFWRIHPEGMAFLLCGFLEDGIKMLSEGHSPNLPGTVFDIILPVWRIGEALLQAQRLARNLFEGPTTIRFIATYSGLSGRALVSIDQRRRVWETHIARQDSITLSTHVDAMAIDTNLPEIVHPLLSPLYALFDFFELSDQFVAEELSHMRGGKY